MPCYRPYQVWKHRSGKSKTTGKHPVTFKSRDGIPFTSQKIACGQCVGCRLEKSREWAIRCMHETKSWEYNYFLTLTYNDEELEKLPITNSLHPPHLQKFWKRLRKAGYNIRYYACGEYGDETDRPHYHAIVYNLKLPDMEHHTRTRNNDTLYTSKKIERLWGHGHVIIGNVSFESCAYVARYIMKKITGKSTDLKTINQEESPQNRKLKLVKKIIKSTGEEQYVESEFQTMSKRPGIGKNFLEEFESDIYQPGTDGTISIRGGIKSKPPHYYDNVYEQKSKSNFKKLERIKEKRRKLAESKSADNTRARLRTKEDIKNRIITRRLPRKIE